MNKVFILLSLSLILFFPAKGYTAILSDQSRISLITCGQGEELYSIFGHTAIRVSDPETGVDRVYNYGTFDFTEPNFYPKFLRGYLKYFLAEESWERFLMIYEYEKRDVFEQEINLTLPEREQVLLFLEQNIRPENRKYLYDFVRDNCTTRVRDVLMKACHGGLNTGHESGITWRQGLSAQLKYHPWTSLGINILLGLNTDQKLSVHQEMFLPGLLMSGMERTKREGGAVWVSSTRQVLAGAPVSRPFFMYFPLLIGIILLSVSIRQTISEFKSNQYNPWFDRGCFFTAGLIGCVVAFMWFGSSHFATQNNLNLLWAFPFHLVFVFFLRQKTSFIQKHYARIVLFMGIAFLLSAGLGVQRFPVELFPVVLTLLIRAGSIIYRNSIIQRA